MDIVFILLICFSLLFFIAYLYTSNQLKLSTQYLAETMLLYLASEENQKDNINIDQPQETIHKENFIKFLSDSRDWAYQYIEDVQTGLEKFIGDVDSHIKYFDEYSSVLSEGRPDFLAMKQISKSYKELKKLLPQDTDDRR